ncbi:MAG: hypothetical protein D6B28_03660 [Gammaproteobacteria bacterium]|nr:MAG: hypothetical protein D6B28_03660 [Gammaproteobacteria bacterium]
MDIRLRDVGRVITAGAIFCCSQFAIAENTCVEITETNYNLVKQGIAEMCGNYHACLVETGEDIGWYSPFTKTTISKYEDGTVVLGACEITCDEGEVLAPSCKTISDTNIKHIMAGRLKFCDGFELCTIDGEKVGPYDPWGSVELSIVGDGKIELGACEVEREFAQCVDDEEGDDYIVLKSFDVTVDEDTWKVELIKLPLPNGGYTYAQWVKANVDGLQPVAISTMPYDLIDWTGEQIDETIAGLYPDFVLDPETLTKGVAGILKNGVGALFTYGRFYTGDSLQNDIDDTVAGLDFLTKLDYVDKSRIAINGISWGGMQALHAAARAPEDLKIVSVVAFAPPSDLGALDFYANQTIPQIVQDPQLKQDYANFYKNYIDRIKLTTGVHVWEDEQAFYPYSNEYLVANINPETDILIPHDTWDTIVPVDVAYDLISLTEGQIDTEALLYPHAEEFDINTQALGHGAGLMVVFNTPFQSIFNYVRLKGDSQEQIIVNYSYDNLQIYIGKLVDLLDQTGDTSIVEFIKPRLQEMADPRIVMVSTDAEGNETRMPGAVLAQEIEEALMLLVPCRNAEPNCEE